MKVTIDTQADTYEDIKKLLHILTEIIQKRDSGVSSFSPQNSHTDTSNLMSMFSEEAQKDVPNTPPDFSSFLNLTKTKREDTNSEPKIELY